MYFCNYYNNIGCICSPSNAFKIVSKIYFGSNTIDRGFVIGLSCLNGTKYMCFLLNSFPMFSALPDKPSFVDIPITNGFSFLK